MVLGLGQYLDIVGMIIRSTVIHMVSMFGEMVVFPLSKRTAYFVLANKTVLSNPSPVVL